jgi:aerobic carbon-monoxide dehydrogenase small subunit
MTPPAPTSECVVQLRVNGAEHTVSVAARTLLVDLIRDRLGLHGTHIGCDSTSCGACTVLLDGRPVKSCTLFAPQVDGCELQTVEGLADGEQLHPLQQAFEDAFAFQCGYCTAGMLMAALPLVDRDPPPDREEIKRLMVGNLCRCTGYTSVVDAVEAAIAVREGARR